MERNEDRHQQARPSCLSRSSPPPRTHPENRHACTCRDRGREREKETCRRVTSLVERGRAAQEREEIAALSSERREREQKKKTDGPWYFMRCLVLSSMATISVSQTGEQILMSALWTGILYLFTGGANCGRERGKERKANTVTLDTSFLRPAKEENERRGEDEESPPPEKRLERRHEKGHFGILFSRRV